MKNKKRIGMVAILLIVGLVALSAAPAFAQGRAASYDVTPRFAAAQGVQDNQAVRQRVMQMDCVEDGLCIADLPAELQAEIAARRAAAELRQAEGGLFQGRSNSRQSRVGKAVPNGNGRR